ncbi:MAG: hypothetical protein WEA09_02285 [Gemmatimonadota bacterium]
MNGVASGVDLLAVAVLLALLLAPLYSEVTLGGVTLKREIERQVKQEVSVAEREALKTRASLDLQLMPVWEREHSSSPSDWSVQKLKLIADQVRDLEAQVVTAPESDRVQYQKVLRELYWEWLAVAREVYASSSPYQDVWRRVEAGFSRIADVPHVPSR